MHRGDRFTSDKTSPTLLSPAALTRGWKLIGSLHRQLLLPKWKSTPDASQRRIWFLDVLSGAAKGTCMSPAWSPVLQHGSCPAGTDQRGEGWATKTWAPQAQQVGAVGLCCQSSAQGASASTHCTQSAHRHRARQVHPFLGLNIPDWFPIPEQHSSEGTYLTCNTRQTFSNLIKTHF